MKLNPLKSKKLRALSTLALLGIAALLCMATSVEAPPRIDEISPEAGAVNVSVDTKVVIRFNIAVDETTVSSEAVTLQDPDGVPVPALLTMGDSWEIVITPEQGLVPETTYRVVLDLDLLRTIHDEAYEGAEEALDLDHDPDENIVSFTFTTGLAMR